jgi:PhnB protein
MTFEVIPFLSFNGRAAQAISFYEQHLDAKVLLKVTYKQMKEMDPAFSYPDGQEEYITHAVLEIGRNKIMLNEEQIDTTRPWQMGDRFSFCIQSKDESTIQTLYRRVTEHKEVTVLAPLAPNRFSPAYGIVRDPFGVVIQLAATKHDF